MRRSILTTCVVSTVLLGCRRPAPAADARTPIALPPEAAAGVRAEMRGMLSAVHDILQADPRDTAAVARAARAAGTAAAADTALKHLLPAAFLAMGMNTHRQFDSLALAVRGGLPRDSVIARLGRLTTNCVSCHAAYRLAPAR